MRQPIYSVNADWFCQWERVIFDPPPQDRHPQRITKNLSQVITSATRTAVLNMVHISPREVFGSVGGGACVKSKYNQNYYCRPME